MKERPILFSGEMVQAIMEGRKTQTRRVVKGDIGERDGMPTLNGQPLIGCPAVLGQCPYGKPGDRLWVREAWKTCKPYDPYSPAQIDSFAAVLWLADNAKRLNGPEEWGRYRHARFMPRWASRITLEITAVRAERLRDITEDDALSEGSDGPRPLSWHPDAWEIGPESYRAGFRELWERTNGPSSWDANPWVWVVEFKRVGSNG